MNFSSMYILYRYTFHFANNLMYYFAFEESKLRLRQSIVSPILVQYMQTKRCGGNKIQFSVQIRVNNKL